jgi:hypothetical protein
MRLRDALKRIARIGERTRQDAEGGVAWRAHDARAQQQRTTDSGRDGH